ncbi:glycerate kinase family protein [Streptomyces ipomoeae]|uniref:glycerate kinase family protein n=1 Tax=Streptomyces ipomoeae TaxID=103232 RepID=UPI0029B4B638|nr:glycerate kinase [Streptomyces ipomoeae]MDX2697084.1 glycerate kinase [Streptomyces ipomoeae]MDX2842630.1 glycerate kinase [Streptomyces ipomoeae]
MLNRVAVAPSGFKESLSAEAAAEAIAAGVRRVLPDAEVDLIPLVDGGEGTAAALAASTGGRLVALPATGPVGEPVGTHFALLGSPGGAEATGSGAAETETPVMVETAVVEMAAVAGLSLVPRALRDPGATTTYGVGELIRAALDTGVRRVLVGCGDSGTSDGGAGALQALGARLLDADGFELPPGGRELARLHRIDASGLDPRLKDVELLVACNPFNVLCGERGVARVFGPQKGATPAQVEQLSAALENWAYVLTRDLAPTGTVLRHGPGTGASGGLGAGLAALGARLLPRFDVLLDHLDLDARLARADLVITAEGALDHQTPRGKVPAEVARRAKLHARPVLAVAGTLGEGAHEVPGVDACTGILPAPMALAEAMVRASELLTDATERALRMMSLGALVTEAQRSYGRASDAPRARREVTSSTTS